MSKVLDLTSEIAWLDLRFRPAKEADYYCKDCGVSFHDFLEAIKAAEYLEKEFPLSDKSRSIPVTQFLKEEFEKGNVEISPLKIYESKIENGVKRQSFGVEIKFTTPYNGIANGEEGKCNLRCNFQFITENNKIVDVDFTDLKHILHLNAPKPEYSQYEVNFLYYQIQRMFEVSEQGEALLSHPRCEKEKIETFLKISNEFKEVLFSMLQKIYDTQPKPKIGEYVSLSKSGLPIYMVGGGATTHGGSFTIVINRRKELKNALFFTRKGDRCCGNQAGVVLNKGDMIISCRFARADVRGDIIDSAWKNGDISIEALRVVDGSVYQNSRGENLVEVDTIDNPYSSWEEIPRSVWRDANSYHNKDGEAFVAPVKNKN